MSALIPANSPSASRGASPSNPPGAQSASSSPPVCGRSAAPPAGSAPAWPPWPPRLPCLDQPLRPARPGVSGLGGSALGGNANAPSPSASVSKTDVAAAEKEDASSEARNESPFYAGFGNRETDAASYASVGVPPGRIFTINPKSEVVAETTKATRRWDLAEMISMANEMFPPEAAGGGAGWADDAPGDGSLIDGVPIDDAFIDSNYWGRGSMDLPEGEALP